jgi:hypothetical protein
MDCAHLQVLHPVLTFCTLTRGLTGFFVAVASAMILHGNISVIDLLRAATVTVVGLKKLCHEGNQASIYDFLIYVGCYK